jgi:hypothetical protein
MRRLLIPIIAVLLCASTDALAQLSFQIKRIEGHGNMARNLEFVDGLHDSLFVSSANRIYHPLYDFNKGPIRVEVTNASLVPAGEIRVALDGVDSTSEWKMYVVGGTDTVYSSSTIGIGDEQLVPQWGLLVQVKQVDNWTGDCDFILDCSIEQQPDPWLRFFMDTDEFNYSSWIRSGTMQDQNEPSLSDYPGDDDECFENILEGTWAPWKLTSHADSMASPSWDKFKSLNYIENTHSVDLIITPDQTRWTRCPVVEIADDYLPSVGGAERFNLRMSPSVDQNGNPDASGTFGMSWFPGYAINVETGERLNMAFGENSWLQVDNGTDMIWNPTSTVESQTGDPILGGGHYIYIFRHNGDNPNDDVPLYDEGAFIYEKLSENNYSPGDPAKRRVYKDAMWVGIPLLESGHNLLESEVRIKLRVRKPYVDYQCLDNVVNQTHPLYSFETSEMSTAIMQVIDIESLRIYPNPATTNLTMESHTPLAQVWVRDVAGRAIMNETLRSTQSDKKTLDVSSLPSGIYLVEALTQNGQRSVQKVVVE